ncbi:hypothetical protein [Candidatus Nanohalovita haloferacivicina]|uniref:hypothetical protein n=1 Tax=Candidatus Nanohalovita haloferacivicina TaxID=2978046 RepID=UPI00325FC065|nr:hypothetical protein HBNXNv_0820 [Candidatus Nanohalobia archaeon BNXNv]
MEFRSKEQYNNENQLSIDELSDLETASHFYALAEIDQQRREEEQLERVQEQLKRYRQAGSPGTRLDRVEEGSKLWAEACIYWDETGMYDIEGLAAVTPVLAVHADLGVNVEDAYGLDEIKEVLDEGMEYFEPQK